jgi:hypothetical protein
MILDDILSDYAALIATLALGLAGEPDSRRTPLSRICGC